MNAGGIQGFLERYVRPGIDGGYRRRVVVQVGWSDFPALGALFDFWEGSGRENSLFLLTFCRSAPEGREYLRRVEAGGCGWARELLDQWPMDLRGMHRMECIRGRMVVLLGVGDCESWLARLGAEVDAILLDASDPALGESPKALTRHLARIARRDAGLLVNFGDDRAHGWRMGWMEALRGSGFCGPEPGVSLQWEGRYVGRTKSRVAAAVGGNRAVVVGGGVAGVSVAASLATRGWGVELFEMGESLASAASGNLAAVCVPMISRDDGVSARLSRACFLHGIAELEKFTRRGMDVLEARCGVLQFPREVAGAAALEQAVRQNGFPSEYVQWWSAQEVAARFACEQHLIRSGAAFFPGAGWVNPGSLCDARLRLARTVRIFFKVRIQSLVRVGGEWELRGSSGEPVAKAPVVILAHGDGVWDWSGSGDFRFKRVRGQVTHVGAGDLELPPWVVCGDGYVTPPVKGFVSIGATYDFEELRGEVLESSGRENLARLGDLIPGCPQVDPLWCGQGRVGFRTLSADRLPVVGALADGGGCGADAFFERLADIPRHEGLYGFLGLGSRGVLWSGLGAECLAAQITGEPLPFEQDLAEALDPARWILRGMRERR